MDVAAQVATALSYIHSQGYVHCDNQPQNIMLVREPNLPVRVVVVDFGVARAMSAATTTLLATPQYLAPERIAVGAPSAASDLDALGLLLYALLVGQPPFDDTNLHAVLEAHRTQAIPALPETLSPARAAGPHHCPLSGQRPGSPRPVGGGGACRPGVRAGRRPP